MFDLKKEFANYIEKEKLIGEGDSILAAVSGGADSICMLLLLLDFCTANPQMNLRLGVVCVNHGFRKEASLEAEYVASICRDRDIPFFLKEIPPGECKNSEEAAREYRYRLIEDTARENGFGKIALAHNSQDRAETILFNFFRGTGITGLIGIRPSRDEFIRPILWMKRSDIEGFLEDNGIEWCTDQSNLEDNYSRNRIRHHIIPAAEGINNDAINHISETADRLSEIEEYIISQANTKIDEIVDNAEDGCFVDIEDLLAVNRVIRKEMYRQLISDISMHLKDITAEHINSIDELVLRNTNAQLDLPYGIKVYRAYDKLYIVQKGKSDDLVKKTTLEKKVLEVSSFEGKITDYIPRNKYTKWFDYDKINGSCVLRNKEDGDSIIIDSKGHRKSINRFMIEQKIPKHLRDKILLVATTTDILWIVGYRDSSAYRIDENTNKILQITIKMED